MNGHSYRPSATRATSRKGKGMWDLPLLGPITTGSDYPETLLGSSSGLEHRCRQILLFRPTTTGAARVAVLIEGVATLRPDPCWGEGRRGGRGEVRGGEGRERGEPERWDGSTPT
uniref:Uncharacterized protein n=1 Tax=Oryza sativa subsp. japonica TaxID=39947 RepID=Q69MS5_ORYSJ|nr:hypothetical protein [Oryza sativa Japonica Group]